MKVLLINGSPNEFGCTYTALKEVAEGLNNEGIETIIYHIGNKAINGCIACGSCRKNSSSHCAINDSVNDCIDLLKECDGLVIGSPVHYASPAGNLISFLDRLFYASTGLSNKVGCAVVSARRAGTTAAFEVLNKYFSISNMPIATSNYWNMVHGSCPSDVLKDLEGMQTMRILATNMAWLLKCIKIGEENGINKPISEKKIKTNFIR